MKWIIATVLVATLALGLLAFVPAASADTADTIDSGLLAAGESFSITFDGEGTFDYLCTPHTWMVGKIIIAENGTADDVTIDIVEDDTDFHASGFAFADREVRIQPGVTVTWTNTGAVDHTVTETGASTYVPTDDHTDDDGDEEEEESPFLGTALVLVGFAAVGATLFLIRRK